MKRLAGLLGALACLPVSAADFKVGPSCSLFELRPGLSSPAALAPGVGVQGGFEWRLWSLEGAVFGNALQLLGGSGLGSTEVSGAVYACLKTPGICAGPLLVLAGPNGGLFHGFTWGRSVGAVFSVSWDALNLLHATTAPAPAKADAVGSAFGP